MAGAARSFRSRIPAVPELGAGPLIGLSLLGIALLLGLVVTSAPGLYRGVLALGLIAVLALSALRWPNPTILAVFVFLPVLGLVRRLLIESTGWPSADPLLLVGPLMALILFAKAYLVESRPLVSDLLSKLMLAFFVIAVLAILNPLGAGLNQTGAVALLLTAIPLLWFFVGRALPDRVTIMQLQYVTAFLAAAIAIYGLYQTEIAFPAWDLAWIDVGGYESLNVGDTVRGFGTMASASEYATYLGAGLVLTVAALLDRRGWPVVVLPILTVGVLFSAVRGTLVLGIVAVAVMLGMRSERPRVVLPTVAVVGLAVYLIAAPTLVSLASATGSDLLTHQLEGIARPFDDDSSTLLTHLELMGDGVSQGFRQPLGEGVAPSVNDSGDLGYSGGGTESDFSDAFVRFGLPGGLLFLVLCGVALASVGRNWRRTRDPLLLGALGLAVLTLGSWLTGGHYALTPLLWLIIGWATRPTDGETERRVSPG